MVFWFELLHIFMMPGYSIADFTVWFLNIKVYLVSITSTVFLDAGKYTYPYLILLLTTTHTTSLVITTIVVVFVIIKIVAVVFIKIVLFRTSVFIGAVRLHLSVWVTYQKNKIVKDYCLIFTKKTKIIS